MGTDPLLWRDFPLRLEAGPRMNSFFGIARWSELLFSTHSSTLSSTFNTATCFRLTRVRSVTIRMEHTEVAVGFLPRNLVLQEKHIQDWRTTPPQHLCKNSPAAGPPEWGPQNREYIPQGTFYYWSCLDDAAVDFVKTTTKDALALDVFVTSLPGRKILPAIFDHMPRRLTFNNNTNIACLEGLLLEKCGKLGILCKDEVEEKEIAAADTILTMMSSGMCVLYEVTMRKVVR